MLRHPPLRRLVLRSRRRTPRRSLGPILARNHLPREKPSRMWFLTHGMVSRRQARAWLRPRDATKARGGARAFVYSLPRQSDSTISRMRAAVSLGVLPTLTPAASRASFLACAVPAEPETMAPAWPIVLPSGAVKPAT
jgi:hypothetical protein